MLVLLIIILHQHCYKNFITSTVYLSISYIQFVDIKGTAWGHGQVIEMCSHAIFYISCLERKPGVTQDYYVYMYIVYVVYCYAAWNNNYSGQEEATLCIVKCLKEDRKLVFQMRKSIQ